MPKGELSRPFNKKHKLFPDREEKMQEEGRQYNRNYYAKNKTSRPSSESYGSIITKFLPHKIIDN